MSNSYTKARKKWLRWKRYAQHYDNVAGRYDAKLVAGGRGMGKAFVRMVEAKNDEWGAVVDFVAEHGIWVRR